MLLTTVIGHMITPVLQIVPPSTHNNVSRVEGLGFRVSSLGWRVIITQFMYNLGLRVQTNYSPRFSMF